MALINKVANVGRVGLWRLFLPKREVADTSSEFHDPLSVSSLGITPPGRRLLLQKFCQRYLIQRRSRNHDYPRPGTDLHGLPPLSASIASRRATLASRSKAAIFSLSAAF